MHQTSYMRSRTCPRHPISNSKQVKLIHQYIASKKWLVNPDIGGYLPFCVNLSNPAIKWLTKLLFVPTTLGYLLLVLPTYWTSRGMIRNQKYYSYLLRCSNHFMTKYFCQHLVISGKMINCIILWFSYAAQICSGWDETSSLGQNVQSIISYTLFVFYHILSCYDIGRIYPCKVTSPALEESYD